MSERWPGGIINQTAPVPAGAFATSAASGIWTLEQQAYWQQQGLWPIPGNLPSNIEDVFSTWLYTSSPQSLSVANGIPLGNASNSQFSLAGYTVTNLGAAFNSSFPLSNLTDGKVEIANAQNIAYVAGAFFDVYVDLVNPAVVTAYNISPQGVRNVEVYNTPQAFIVKASNDASTWTTIATFTGISQSYPDWNAGTFRVFSFANTTAYRYWRIENTVAGVSMSEWNLTGTTTAPVKGGLVWMKARNTAGFIHALFDTSRGVQQTLCSNTSDAQATESGGLTAFSPNGFSLGSWSQVNSSSIYNYASWTFAEQPKFFDIVTYTGNSTARTIAHNLGSAPGMIIIKSRTNASNWQVYHRSIGPNFRLVLDASVEAINIGASCWNSTDPTSTVFSLGTNSNLNTSGQTYVAYLFAHNAGGFGPSGNDNVVSCGSTVVSSNTANVTLGYEPQWVMMKRSSGVSDWFIVDNMRGFSSSASPFIRPNTSDAESPNAGTQATATGFTSSGVFDDGTYIYMAIRRPTGVPTLGTQVYNAITYTGDSVSNRNIATGGFSDIVFSQRPGSANAMWTDRLRGGSSLAISTTQGDADSYWDLPSWYSFAQNSGYTSVAVYGYSNSAGGSFYSGSLKRAAGFCDVVCYTGTGVATTQAHNLTVAPELMIVKRRNDTSGWFTYVGSLGNTSYLQLQDTSGSTSGVTVLWNSTSPTSSVFTIGTNSGVNFSGGAYLAYLFATCPGVSKVGTFTGTGGTQTINCGFGAAGARWLLVKRTDSTGDWYNFNSSFGFTSSSSPYTTTNVSNAQVTGNNGCYADSTGFTVTSTASSTVNISGATYIFLAIA